MYHTILVPLDGSAFGEQALPVARSIARRAGPTLRLAHVHVGGQSSSVEGCGVPDDSVDIQVRAAELAYLEQLAQRASASSGVPMAVVLLDGPVADALCDDARATDADRIVMSTHGRGALARVWLGRVAKAVARQAPAPLLLVRPHHLLANLAHEPVFRHVPVPLDESPLAEQAIEQMQWRSVRSSGPGTRWSRRSIRL